MDKEYCKYCVDVETAKKQEAEFMKKYGYYIHLVPDVAPMDIHTHGLMKSFKLFELDFKIDLSPKNALFIVNTIAQDYIKNGLFYGTRIICLPELNNQNVAMKYTSHDNNIVIRCILVDKNGKFPWDEGCDPLFKVQWNEQNEKDYKTITETMEGLPLEYIQQTIAERC